MSASEHRWLTYSHFELFVVSSRLKLWQETGDVVTHRATNLHGRPHLLDRDDIDYVLRLVSARPEHFLKKLLSLVNHNRFISIHFATILGFVSSNVLT
ncbi:hypothetical protein OG21DRAFT_1428408 [Imleria badia]|nr:hypothetical protein OG21DRAFT_1428408 [Imleria badia]